VVVVSGELDLASRVGLPDLLAELNGPVVIDLAQLSFIDSSGISALVQARKRIEQAGASLRLTRPQKRVIQTLEIIGLADWVVPWVPAWA
jgi:anti-anti-sigma factor